jgi:hypothetical protein
MHSFGNDSISKSSCTEWSDLWTGNIEAWNEGPWLNLMHYSGIYPEEVKESRNNLGQDTRRSVRDIEVDLNN